MIRSGAVPQQETAMRRAMKKLLVAAMVSAVLQVLAAGQQNTTPPQQAPEQQQKQTKEPKPAPQAEQEMEQMHHMGRIPVVKPEFPKLGRAQEHPSGRLIRLEELEQMALANNPTLVQAQAEIRATKARQLQSGLYPNPTVGYSGEELRGGS